MNSVTAPSGRASIAAKSEPSTFLTLCIGHQSFALSVAPVREILDEQNFVVLPDAPSDVVGLIDVRGEGVIVLDVSHRLGVNSTVETGRRIIVLEQKSSGENPLAILADRVLSVVELAESDIEEPPKASSMGVERSLLCGIVRLNGNMTLILDHKRLLGESTGDEFDFPS